MALGDEEILPGAEYPPRADLRREIYQPLPKVAPGTIDPASITGDVATDVVKAAVAALNAALLSKDAEKLADCFSEEQAFWRDNLALTAHLRTFRHNRVISEALLLMDSLRTISGGFEVSGEPRFIAPNPQLVSLQGRSTPVEPACLHNFGADTEGRCLSTAAWPSAPARPL
jgi:hypothetical protein